MAQSIADCQVLIAGGMGWGAYESLKSYGIEIVVTDVVNIEEAVKLYLEGKLQNLTERLRSPAGKAHPFKGGMKGGHHCLGS